MDCTWPRNARAELQATENNAPRRQKPRRRLMVPSASIRYRTCGMSKSRGATPDTVELNSAKYETLTCPLLQRPRIARHRARRRCDPITRGTILAARIETCPLAQRASAPERQAIVPFLIAWLRRRRMRLANCSCLGCSLPSRLCCRSWDSGGCSRSPSVSAREKSEFGSR
jgi:hypothetical protein